MKPKVQLRRILAICLAATLAACGGGGGAGASPAAPGGGGGPSTGNPGTGTALYGPLTDAEKALVGTDADANGVRDDVDAWIASSYSDAASRAAATVTAQWETWAMIRGSRGTSTTTTELNSWSAAQSCLYDKASASMGGSAPSINAWNAELLNTHARAKAYLTWDASTDSMPSSVSVNPCNDIKPMTTP